MYGYALLKFHFVHGMLILCLHECGLCTHHVRKLRSYTYVDCAWLQHFNVQIRILKRTS